jgi:hypothetical protein
VDISLEAEGPGSSLATTTIPDMMDLVSVGSSFNRTGSDILLPPLLPESRSLVHMRKLKSLDKVTECTLYQFSGYESGSGSTCFWTTRIRIYQSNVWIRILLSSRNNSKKNLDSYCFVTSFGLFIFDK